MITSTKSGPSTDASVLEALRQFHELPDLLLQWRSFDEGMAFLKGNGLDVFMPFTGLMQNTLGPAFFAIEGVA